MTRAQAATIGAGLDAVRWVRPDRHSPALDTIITNVAGWALRAGEAFGVDDFDTVWRRLGLLVGGHLEDKSCDFAAEVRARLLQFGLSAA